jgi:hypothetical protein
MACVSRAGDDERLIKGLSEQLLLPGAVSLTNDLPDEKFYALRGRFKRPVDGHSAIDCQRLRKFQNHALRATKFRILAGFFEF